MSGRVAHRAAVDGRPRPVVAVRDIALGLAVLKVSNGHSLWKIACHGACVARENPLVLDSPRPRPIVREGVARPALRKSDNEETAMDVSISLLKDLADAIGSADEGLAKIADGIKHLVVTGVEGYDATKERISRQRMLDASARAEHLLCSQSPMNADLKDFVSRQVQPDDGDRTAEWKWALEATEAVLDEVAALVDYLDTLRRDFVLEPAYVQLRESLAARQRLLAELRRMPPPTSPEELQLVRKVTERYDVLILEFRQARDQMNAYIRSLKPQKE
ncbi:hypothetical protein [Paraburkholderia youngii]|uniref:hypothetical protein n=1 Tax=Paraburkholderia youngii TaxID=2782701 RepID=UPI001592AF00|nr:hypothetical protein [Paraburkholderia youngii]NUX59216.1 hypothetical protein [Paraburkholderia youngii]